MAAGRLGREDPQVFDETSIPTAVRILERREASLWHACQLVELAAYLRLGGIAPRTALEQAGVSVAPLAADLRDRAAGGWDRVTLRLEDIGHGFAAGWHLLPNLRGPITIQAAPSLLTDAARAAFSLRAPTDAGFDGGRHVLQDAGRVDDLFLQSPDKGFPFSTSVRVGERLAEAFGVPDADASFVTLLPRDAVLSLDHVVAVWVDPLAAGEVQLVDAAQGLSELLDVPLRVRRRMRLDDSRAAVWRDIGRVVARGEQPLALVARRRSLSAAFRAWARELQAAGLDREWERLGHRLASGTMPYLELAAGVARTEAAAHGGDAGFWSSERRAASRRAMRAGEPLPLAAARACGHPARSWDAGVCYACVGRYRSRWRYEAPRP